MPAAVVHIWWGSRLSGCRSDSLSWPKVETPHGFHPRSPLSHVPRQTQSLSLFLFLFSCFLPRGPPSLFTGTLSSPHSSPLLPLSQLLVAPRLLPSRSRSARHRAAEHRWGWNVHWAPLEGCSEWCWVPRGCNLAPQSPGGRASSLGASTLAASGKGRRNRWKLKPFLNQPSWHIASGNIPSSDPEGPPRGYLILQSIFWKPTVTRCVNLWGRFAIAARANDCKLISLVTFLLTHGGFHQAPNIYIAVKCHWHKEEGHHLSKTK